MSSDDLQELHQALTTCAVADRLKIISYDNRNILCIAEKLLQVIRKDAVIAEMSFDQNRQDHRNHKGDIIAVSTLGHKLTVTFIKGDYYTKTP